MKQLLVITKFHHQKNEHNYESCEVIHTLCAHACGLHYDDHVHDIVHLQEKLGKLWFVSGKSLKKKLVSFHISGNPILKAFGMKMLHTQYQGMN